MKLRVLLALLTVGAALGAAADPPAGKQDPIQAARQKYAKHPADALKIAEPVEVTKVIYYKDGGSIHLQLTDAKKTEHKFCFDGRKRGVFPIEVGVTYPGQEGGKVVEFRGPEEQALYGVLLRWAKKHPASEVILDEQKEIDHKKYPDLWEVRVFFLRLERRFTEGR